MENLAEKLTKLTNSIIDKKGSIINVGVSKKENKQK